MLSKRLQTVLQYIDINDKIADIGCDHGYLGLYAVKKGVKYVQLIDNKIGPLNAAKKNMAKVNNQSAIFYSLSDGLNDVNQIVNVVTICGMGGDLISKIILDNIEVAKKMDYLILEANNKVDYLRKNLNQNNFLIIDEQIVYEKKKYYQIIKVKYQQFTQKLNELEIFYGPILLKKKSECFLQYLNFLLENYQQIVINNPNSLAYLNNKIDEIKGVLNETNKN